MKHMEDNKMSEMPEMLSVEEVYKLMIISEKIHKSKKFGKEANWRLNLTRYFDGWQFNWASKNYSLMWRSVRWPDNQIECYTGSDITELFDVGEI